VLSSAKLKWLPQFHVRDSAELGILTWGEGGFLPRQQLEWVTCKDSVFKGREAFSGQVGTSGYACVLWELLMIASEKA
jgi:hypothetical protein